jgi:hypothetical protein
MAKLSSKKSKKGMIYIRGYTRKDGTRVKGHYAKDMGAPGRTPKGKRVLPKLKKGEFHRYGYRLAKSSKARHRALLKAVKRLGYSTVIKRLVVLRTYSKRIRANRLRYDKDIKGLQTWRLAHPKRKSSKKVKKTKKVKKRRTSRR